MKGSSIGVRWWKLPKKGAHDECISAFEQVEHLNRGRRDADERHVRLYAGVDLAGLRGGDYYQIRDTRSLTYNVVASVTDTIGAKIAKNRPRATFLTDGADFTAQRKAKYLSRFSEGAFEAVEAYEQGPSCFRDACVTGTGAFKVYSDGKRIYGERTFPWDLYVDPLEALYGRPRTLYQTANYDRGVLLELFGAKDEGLRAKILAAEVGTKDSGKRSQADQVRVIEAWRLPSGRNADDGRHLIAIDGATLKDEPWKRSSFPFAFLRWTPRQVGFWGQGIAERLTAKQYEINLTLDTISKGLRIHGRPILAIERGSHIELSHITDEIDNILEYDGTPPTLLSYPVFPREVYDHLQRLKEEAYEEIGVSQLSASSRKPAGIESGTALREYNDIESERFILAGRAYEEFFLDIAKLVIAEAREMPGYRVQAPNGKALMEIEWSDVDLEEEAYVMRCFPTSSLPTTPAGRLEQIQEFIKMGLPFDEGLRLMDMPDLETFKRRRFAGNELVEQILERMIEDGEEAVPEPYMPLEYAKNLAHDLYLQHRAMRGFPESRLAMLRQWIDDCEALLSPAPTEAPATPPGAGAAPPMGPEGMPPGMPPGMPGAPPGMPPAMPPGMGGMVS